MRYKQRKFLEQNHKALEDYIQDNKLDITPEYMIHCITEADPDQQQFKNSKWLIKNLLDQKFLWEDIESGNESKAFDTLNRFLNIRKQWPESNLRDINQYVGLSGIAEKIRPFEITKGMNEIKREEKAKVYNETIVLYDKNDYLVVIPKTEEASCFWGRNTEWCTAATKSKNYFDYYNKNGPLIICITPDNKKYQFHIDSCPMDENDKALEDITDPILIQLVILTGRLKDISEEYRTKKLCEIAVQNDGYALQYVPDELRTKDLCDLAVKQNGEALEYVPIQLRTKEIYRLAVKQNGLALYYVPKELITLELCELSVRNHGVALLYVPDRFKTKELCELAVKQNGNFLLYATDELKTKELCELAVKKHGRALEYVPEELITLELCKLAIEQDRMVWAYIPEKFRTLEIYKLFLKQKENNIEQEVNDSKWLENKEYEVLQREETRNGVLLQQNLKIISIIIILVIH